MPQAVLAPGATLRDGRFTIVGVIARGGQAITFEAIDKRVGQRVALKCFSVSGATSWKDVELAEREARVLAALNHPNLPKYVDHFEEAGTLYLALEYIEGPTLEQLRHAHAVQQRDVVAFLCEMADTLEYLHHQSPPIIHRDIKPRNVIRNAAGHFVLVDFGSVRDKLRPEGGSTVVGTFGYMAPEQFQGRAMPASDVYAAGATALALLSGRDPDQLPHQGLRLDVNAALSDANVQPRLKQLLQAALDPDPDKRATRSLAQLLQEHQLSTSEQSAGDSRSPPGTSARPRPAEATPAAPDGNPEPSAAGSFDAFSDGLLNQPLARLALRVPFVMVLVTLILTLLRVALGVVLGVVLPLVFSVLHRVLHLPFGDAARESRATARAVRAQLRRLTKQLRASRHGGFGTRAAQRAAQRGARRKRRYRVAADSNHNRARTKPAAANPATRLAVDIETEAERLEEELERRAEAWEGRFSRKE